MRQRSSGKLGVLLAAAMVLGITGCGAGTEGTASSDVSAQKTDGSGEKLVIGVALNEEIDFVNELQNALEEKAAQAGDIEVIFTNANGDAEKQLSDAGVACVEAIKEAGIYCVIQDTPVNTDLYDCRIVGDQSMVGQLVGTYMQEWLDGDESRMIHMGYINGNTSETIKKRETGIYDAVDPARIETFSSQVAQGFSAEGAMSYAEDWLQSQPDMNCIACANDEMAAAAIQALTAAGIDFEDFLVFGCDGGAIGQQYLESGELDATVYQSVSKVAETVLEVSRGLADGQTYENKMYDPKCYELLTKDNMDKVLKNN